MDRKQELLDELMKVNAKLLSQIAALKLGLEFYAEEDAYILHPNLMPPGQEDETLIDLDKGETARRALAEIDG